MFVLTLLAAHAADVVWLEPADDDQRAAVLAASGGSERDRAELRAAATAFGPDDEAALRDLSKALADVRAYETQLDGELVIMRDLQAPVDRIGLLRDESDRSALFAALAYQGFAVDRYFGDRLASAEQAAPYRAELNGLAIERPWLDAVALEPEREVTAYDIAEAPQRIAYAGARAVVGEVLPASIRPPSVRGTLVVDGREVTAGASGDVKVPPGRHLAHVVRDGRIIERFDLRLAPGEQATLEPSVDDADVERFLADPSTGLPEGLAASVDAMGGEVWLARPGDRSPVVWSVTPDGVTEVPIEMPRRGGGAPTDGAGRPALQVAVLGGWTGSQDFYYQDPRNPAEASTVNAPTVAASLGTSVRVGPLSLGAGVDAFVPLGAYAVARTADRSMRVRPVPHLTAGLGPASVAVGYALPYHPAVGLRGGLPLPGPLELRWAGWFGLPGSKDRVDAEPYTTRPLGLVGAGLGARL
jgi:hypothetical protein